MTSTPEPVYLSEIDRVVLVGRLSRMRLPALSPAGMRHRLAVVLRTYATTAENLDRPTDQFLLDQLIDDIADALQLDPDRKMTFLGSCVP